MASTLLRKVIPGLIGCAVLFSSLSVSAGEDGKAAAEQILKAANLRKAVCLLIEFSDGTLAGALHDGGVIISNNQIIAARCMFPLSRRTEFSKTLGTRHRAAVGLTEETDGLRRANMGPSGSILASHWVVRTAFHQKCGRTPKRAGGGVEFGRLSPADRLFPPANDRIPTV